MNTIKIGAISSVNPAKGTARVVFRDDSGVVSHDMQVLQTNTGANQDYAMPDVGTDVVCAFLGTGVEDGFILGSVYSSDNPPAESSSDVRALRFSDGTTIKYNRAGHVLDIVLGGTTIQITGSSATISASNITITGSVTCNGNITCSGDVVASGISLTGHTHSCPQGGTTSGPQ